MTDRVLMIRQIYDTLQLEIFAIFDGFNGVNLECKMVFET